jgi:predicted nucleotidyltransferase
MDENFERRKFKRCVVKLPIELESSDSPIKASSYDLSVGGICVHSKEHFPINSSVHIILSIPIKKEETVKEIKVIGKVLRVDELSTDNGSVNAHGIKFKSIGNEDLIILKAFLKTKYCLDKKLQEAKEPHPDNVVLKDEEMGKLKPSMLK